MWREHLGYKKHKMLKLIECLIKYKCSLEIVGLQHITE